MDDRSGQDPSPIPDSASEDIPPASVGNPEATKPLKDPEGDHRRGMDRTKLKFAIIFASVTAAGAVVLALVEYFSPGFGGKSSGVLASMGDTLKLLATTSLGFIFGRTLGNNNAGESDA